MQKAMTFEPCSRCGQPILLGEPAMQNLPRTGYGAALVDIDDCGRAVSSRVKTYHLRGRCYDEAKRTEQLADAA